MAGRRRKEPEERFWPKVDKRGPDDRRDLLAEVDRLSGLLATLRDDTRHGCSTPCCGCAASIKDAVRAAEPTP